MLLADPLAAVPDAIRWRRAIKHFDSTYEMPDGLYTQILTAARRTTSPSIASSVRLVSVGGREMRQQITSVGFSQPQFSEASKILVVFFDTGDAMTGEPAESRRVRDFAMNAGAFVAQKIMIEAARRFVDSCPMIGFDFDAVGRMLCKPNHYLLIMMIALGKRRVSPPPRGSRLGVHEVLSFGGTAA